MLSSRLFPKKSSEAFVGMKVQVETVHRFVVAHNLGEYLEPQLLEKITDAYLGLVAERICSDIRNFYTMILTDSLEE